MEPERGFEPGSAEYKATALPFDLSSIDNRLYVNIRSSGFVLTVIFRSYGFDIFGHPVSV